MSDLMVRNEPGSRSSRRRARNTKRALGRSFLMIVLAALASLGGLVLTRAVRDGGPEPIGQAGDGNQLTVLVAMTAFDDPSQRAQSLVVFGIDRTTLTDPVALFVPTGTFGAIPGQSSIEQVGKALIFGRETLQETTIENLLGLQIDHTVVMSDVDLARVIEAVGGVDVTIEEALYEVGPNGVRELAFPTGDVHLDGVEAVTFMTYRATDESELGRNGRAQQVWDGLVAAMLADPDGAPELTAIPGVAPAAAAALADVLTAFGAVPEDASYDSLAVTSVGGSALTDVYAMDDAAPEQIARMFGGSAPPLLTELGQRPRIELRNGAGVPEIGSRAAAALVPEGFQLEVVGNAASFGTRTTQIVVYAEDEASLALAERARALLGVGTVMVGTRGQTVVDLTIVLGRDFARKA